MTAARFGSGAAGRCALLGTAFLINGALLFVVYQLVTPRQVEKTAHQFTAMVEMVRLVPSLRALDAPQRSAPPPPPPAVPRRAPALPSTAPVATAAGAAAWTAAAPSQMPAPGPGQSAALAALARAIGPRPAASSASAGAGAAGANGRGGADGGAHTSVLQLEANDIEFNLAPSFKASPPYPIRALKEGIEGVVTVEFVIDVEGNVREPRILHANPPELFDAAVMNALAKWKFSPKLVNGRPVERRARQDVVFRLNRQ